GACGMIDRAAGGRNALAFDQNFARRDDPAAFGIEQTGRMQHDRMRRLRCRGLRVGSEAKEGRHQPHQSDVANFHGRYPLSRAGANRLYWGGDGKLPTLTNCPGFPMTVTLDSLPTPSLLLDQARLIRNAERMRSRMASLGVTFRPHLKTAKSVDAA